MVRIMNNQDYDKLEKNIGYSFKDRSIIITSLTHTSFANEMKINKRECYERNEYLGDAILEFIVSEYLFKNYSGYTEGKLTKLRASLVCEFTLSQVSRSLGFGDYVYLSRGEEQTGGRNRDSILCDLFESVLGAIYLDGGLEPAKSFVYNHLLQDIETKSLFYDAKSTLQEILQKEGKSLTYKLVDTTGPDHNRIFVVEALIDGKPVAKSRGSSKKNAEQTAAYNALMKLKG
jgi:ribonuclease-3